ncbi:MAG TPA: MOFRL family protein [Thermoleophilia bacterium]
MIVAVVDSVDREVREGSGAHAAMARVLARRDGVRLLPRTLLSAGETIVTVRRPGREGGSVDGLLEPSLATEADDAVWAMAAGTDSGGGVRGDAGDFLTSDALSRERKIGVDPTRLLHSTGSGTFFARFDGLVLTAATRTIANDLRAILSGRPSALDDRGRLGMLG